MKKKFINLFLILLCSLVLSGCLGDMLKAKPDDTAFFMLMPVNQKSDVDVNIVINMMPATLPAYMSRSQLVIASNVVRVELSENARWIENIEAGVSRVIADNLKNSLGKNATVYLYPMSAQVSVNSLRITITDLIGSIGGQTKIKAKWIYSSDNENKELLSGYFEKSIDTGSSYEEYVKSMSALLGALSEDISSKIITHNKE